MIGALDELAKVSLILSWRLSYLRYGDDQDKNESEMDRKTHVIDTISGFVFESSDKKP